MFPADAIQFLKKSKDKNFWKKVRTDAAYKPFIDDLMDMYEQYCKGEIVDISYDAFMVYHKTGSRKEFEYSYYFPRRHRLNALALLSLIYPENEEYFSNLCNTIWAICNEYCWSLPNHTKNSENEYNDIYIDLFAAETGYALSEIKYLLGDRFSTLMNSRIHAEVEKRIIHSFIDNTYSWESYGNNWAAVCGGSVGCAFMYERPDLFYHIKPRIDNAMEHFLSSFKADGVCREGIGYWNYGFGFFTCYAQMLLEFSKGEINLFNDQHVKTIAQFPSMMFINGDVTISFSDGSKQGKISLSASSILKQYYGDLIVSLPQEFYSVRDHCARWCKHIRAIVFFDPDDKYALKEKSDEEYFMEESAWFSKRTSAYGFAAKAGDNDEPHNHNDIGSFIFACNQKQVLADIGAGEYTRDYFTENTRYTIFCNRSKGHSVPIIDGLEQQSGKNFCGTMIRKNGGIEIDMTNAYPKNSVIKAVRYFSFENSSVTLTDSFEYEKPCPVTERFITYIEPKINNGYVELENVKLIYNSENWKASISSVVISNHQQKDVTVYSVDFEKISDTCEFKMEISL